MENVENNLPFLFDTVEALSAAGIETWVFGGWAEEIHGLEPPRPHKDIDLLYPAEDFDLVDAFVRSIEAANEGSEIVAKRFSHKRAFERQGVRVEVFLVKHSGSNYVTDFFGSYRHCWPPATFNCEVHLIGRRVHIAGIDAVIDYRKSHGEVEAAYRTYAGASA